MPADDPFREPLVHGCLLVALIDGEASGAELALLESFAEALEVPHHAIATAAEAPSRRRRSRRSRRGR